MSDYLTNFLNKVSPGGGGFLVLDTETTGIDGEICQIAIISHSGQTLLDSLVKPSRPIPASATAVHGISNAMVADAPVWADVRLQVAALVANKDVVIYNSGFDTRMLYNSDRAHGIERHQWLDLANWWCAMEAFAEVYGEWNDYHGNYRWQRLSTAAAYYDIAVKDAHTALGDCLLTLAVVLEMVKAVKS
jgi:DNA polymerase-3 subunit epsilon